MHRPRLESSFLWQEEVEEPAEPLVGAGVSRDLKPPPNPKDKFKGAFGKARVCAIDMTLQRDHWMDKILM